MLIPFVPDVLHVQQPALMCHLTVNPYNCELLSILHRDALKRFLKRGNPLHEEIRLWDPSKTKEIGGGLPSASLIRGLGFEHPVRCRPSASQLH